MKVAKFFFTSPVHLGEKGIGIESVISYIPSDTLFSAICINWGLLYGKSEVDALISKFNESEKLPFSISSGFPFIEDKDGVTTYFFPRPYSQLNTHTLREDQRKKLKDLQFVDKDFFEQWIKWERVDVPEEFRVPDTQKELLSRNAIDRITQQSEFFYCGAVKFKENAGLYCLIDEKEDSKLGNVLEFMQEQGFGGERKIGLGRFRLKWDEIALEQPKNPNRWISLSLYYPTEEESKNLLSSLEAYDLIPRRGFSESPFFENQIRRKSCRMFKEGSVFKKELKGKLVDVTPDKLKLPHKIYRYGFAFNIGMKIGNAED